jgi:RimJ/RimL family protein N-acetyltransferase
MIQIKPITDEIEALWARMRTRAKVCEDTEGLVAYDDKKIVACAVFDSFTVDACNVHWCIANPFVLRHGFITAICDYAFHERGRERIFGLVPSDNPKALKLDTHIGMHEVARIPDAYAKGIDYIILRMDKSECRWLSDIPEEKAA